MDKSEKLFQLSNDAFSKAIEKLSANQLDFQTLIGFLKSGDGDKVTKTQILLLKFFPNQLDEETLYDFLESSDGNVRDKTHALLGKGKRYFALCPQLQEMYKFLKFKKVK